MGNVIHLRRPSERPGEDSGNQSHAIFLNHLRQFSDEPEVREVVELLTDIRKHHSHPKMLGAFEKNNSVLAREVKDGNNDVLELIVADYLRCNPLGEKESPTELRQFELELHVKHVLLSTLEEYQEAMTAIRREVADVTEKKSDVVIKDTYREKIQKARYSNIRINAAFSLLEGLSKLKGASEELILAGIGYSDPILSDEDIDRFSQDVETLAEQYLEALSLMDPKVMTGLAKIKRAKDIHLSKWETKDVLILPQRCRHLHAILTYDTDVVPSLIRRWLETDFGNFEHFARLVDQVVTEAQCYLAPESGTGLPFVPVKLERSTEPPVSRPRCPTIPAGPPPLSGLPLRLPSDNKTIPPPSVSVPPGLPSVPVSFDEKNLTPEEKAYVFENKLHTLNPGTLTSIAFAMSGSIIEVPDGAKLDLFMASDNITIKLLGPNAYAKIEKVTRTCKGIRVLGKNGAQFNNLELGDGVADKLVR